MPRPTVKLFQRKTHFHHSTTSLENCSERERECEYGVSLSMNDRWRWHDHELHMTKAVSALFCDSPFLFLLLNVFFSSYNFDKSAKHTHTNSRTDFYLTKWTFHETYSRYTLVHAIGQMACLACISLSNGTHTHIKISTNAFLLHGSAEWRWVVHSS